MAINKVIYGGETLMDITDSTVTPETLAEGVSSYNAAGERIIGTMTGGASSWDDLTDRPFGEYTAYGDTLTWDGNTEGLYNVLGMFYKVSDAIPTLADLQNGGAFTIYGADVLFSSDNIMNVEDLGAGNDCVVILINGDPAVGVALKEGASATLGGVTATFEETGVFLLGQFAETLNAFVYISKLTIKGYTGFENTKVKTIDYKYLPEALRFGGEIEYLDKLTWDGETAGLDMVTMIEGYAYLYRVSDAVPTIEELSAGFTSVNSNGVVTSGGADDVQILGDGYWAGGAVFAPYDGVLIGGSTTVMFPKKGTYFTKIRLDSGGPLNWTTEFSINNYKFPVGEFKPFDIKYLPESHQFGGEKREVEKITWDGNTDGLESIAGYLFRVSSATPSFEDLQAGGVIGVYFGDEIEEATFTSENVMDTGADILMVEAESVGMVAIVLKDNASLEGVTIPKAGIYFPYEDGFYCSSFTINGYTFIEGDFKPFDIKYLPESHQYGEFTTTSNTLEWDGTIAGKEYMDLSDNGTSGSYVFVKLSDDIVTLFNLKNGVTIELSNGDVITASYDDLVVLDDGVSVNCENWLWFLPQPTDSVLNEELSAGVWTHIIEGTHITKFTIPNYVFKTTEVKPIETKYLPESHQFGEETVTGDTLTWDGDMTGRAYAEMEMPIDDENTTPAYIVKVSNTIPTFEELQNGGSLNAAGQVVPFPYDENVDISIEVTDFGSAISLERFVLIAKEDNADLSDVLGIVLPEKGVYFVSVPAMGVGVDSFTINGYTGFVTTEIKTLDTKYLAPFQTKDYIESLTAQIDGASETMFYKLTDEVLTLNYLSSVTVDACVYGEVQHCVLDTSQVTTGNGIGFLVPFKIEDGAIYTYYILVVPSDTSEYGELLTAGTYVYGFTFSPNTESITLGLAKRKETLKPECLPTDYIQSMINNSLGVIENGSY